MPFLDTWTNVSPGTTGSYQDVDVSSYVPAGATGVMLRIRNVHASSDYQVGVREKGNTDDNYGYILHYYHYDFFVGLDANRKFQAKIENANIQIWLYGYFDSGEADWLASRVDKTPAQGVWADIDCSANIPSGSIAAICELFYTSGHYWGVRKKGSTDTRMNYIECHAGLIIGVDTNRKFQAYKYFAYGSLYLLGYLTKGFFKDNGLDKSLGVTGSYQTIDVSGDSDSAGKSGALVEVYSTSGPAYYFGLRKPGVTTDLNLQNRIGWHAVGMNTSRQFEGKISSTNMDFYVLGYFAGADERRIDFLQPKRSVFPIPKMKEI